MSLIKRGDPTCATFNSPPPPQHISSSHFKCTINNQLSNPKIGQGRLKSVDAHFLVEPFQYQCYQFNSGLLNKIITHGSEKNVALALLISTLISNEDMINVRHLGKKSIKQFWE